MAIRADINSNTETCCNVFDACLGVPVVHHSMWPSHVIGAYTAGLPKSLERNMLQILQETDLGPRNTIPHNESERMFLEADTEHVRQMLIKAIPCFAISVTGGWYSRHSSKATAGAAV